MSKPSVDEMFEYYVSLGSSRTIQKVADHFKVPHSTARRYGIKNKWKEKVENLKVGSTSYDSLENVSPRIERILKNNPGLKVDFKWVDDADKSEELVGDAKDKTRGERAEAIRAKPDLVRKLHEIATELNLLVKELLNEG